MRQISFIWLTNRRVKSVGVPRLLHLAFCVAIGLSPSQIGRAADRPSSTEGGAIVPTGALGRLAPGGNDHKGGAAVLALQYARNGRWLVWRHAEGTIRVWDLEKKKESYHLERLPGSGAKSFALSADDAWLAVGCSEDGGKSGNVRVIEAASGRESGRLPYRAVVPGFGIVGTLAFSPDGRLLAAACHDGRVRLWSWNNRQELPSIQCAISTSELAFSPDSKFLATGNSRPRVTVWDAGNGKAICELGEAALLGVYDLAFAPDGRCLATGVQGGGAQLWDLSSRQRVRELKASAVPVRSLAFSRGGHMLATRGDDGTISIWEVRTGKQRLAFNTQRSYGALAFSHDGSVLASGETDGSVVLWDARPLPGNGGHVPEHSDDTRETAWRALSSREAASSYRAMCFLLADRPRLCAFLREQFTGQHFECDPGTVRRWVTQLDADRFEDREAASAALRQWSFLVPAEVRTAAGKARSTESRARLNNIIAGWDEPSNQPEWLRWLRCLELLESDGSEEAQKLLAQLVERFPESLLAEAAKGCLGRLQHRR
jgi:hypothetical protein